LWQWEHSSRTTYWHHHNHSGLLWWAGVPTSIWGPADARNIRVRRGVVLVACKSMSHSGEKDEHNERVITNDMGTGNKQCDVVPNTTTLWGCWHLIIPTPSSDKKTSDQHWSTSSCFGNYAHHLGLPTWCRFWSAKLHRQNLLIKSHDHLS
jgi:hypothetical protein